MQGSARKKGADSELENGPRKYALSVANRRKDVHSVTQVTWLRLLRELHVLTYNYWPDDCPGLVHTEKSSPGSHMDAGKSWLPDLSTDSSCTDIGII
jgi:hypothetical protein